MLETIQAGSSLRLEDDTSLLDAGIIDSYTILQIHRFLAESFHVTAPPDDYRLENCQSIANLVERLSA
ncbi:MAG: acyl carrier protein [Planctomycetes bacterium]|nr:acyl carrier protein [Planctomycetota bacterium]